jgi:hypothetical protein
MTSAGSPPALPPPPLPPSPRVAVGIHEENQPPARADPLYACQPLADGDGPAYFVGRPERKAG